ncbi:hypothetical protein LTR16_008942, partial [Cryomyces antarcticus]
ISTLYKIYTDWYEADQTFVYNHLELGSESQWSLINTTSGTPDSFSIGYVQNWVLNNPNGHGRTSTTALSRRLNV